MISKDITRTSEITVSQLFENLLQRLRPAQWEIMILVSFCVGLGHGWTIISRPTSLLSPLSAAFIMTLITFVGWYVWGLFTFMTDVFLFGGHSDYTGTLNAFARAYLFQALFMLTFTPPFGWLWGWIAFYTTIIAWGIIGPRQLGMRTWQAIVASTLGMLLWLACLLVLEWTLIWDGLYMGIGAFLA